MKLKLSIFLFIAFFASQSSYGLVGMTKNACIDKIKSAGFSEQQSTGYPAKDRQVQEKIEFIDTYYAEKLELIRATLDVHELYLIFLDEICVVATYEVYTGRVERYEGDSHLLSIANVLDMYPGKWEPLISKKSGGHLLRNSESKLMATTRIEENAFHVLVTVYSTKWRSTYNSWISKLKE
jgi:hypothetical protein